MSTDQTPALAPVPEGWEAAPLVTLCVQHKVPIPGVECGPECDRLTARFGEAS